MDDEEDARTLLKSAETAPRNLLYSLALNRRNGMTSQFYPAPSFRTYAVNQRQGHLGKLQTSAAEHLERMKTEVEAFRDELEKVICRLRHTAVSSNSFHGQIIQKAVHQLSDQENKKCSH